MKKIKIAMVALMLGVATYGGIQTYEHLTMTEAERLMMENIEALTWQEAEGYCDGYCGNTWKCTGQTSCTANTSENWVRCDYGDKHHC